MQIPERADEDETVVPVDEPVRPRPGKSLLAVNVPEPTCLCPWCGDPVYGDRTAHDCCEANKTKNCPACAASKKAEREWMRVSRVCVVCNVRCRFSFGDTCPRCLERIREEREESERVS